MNDEFEEDDDEDMVDVLGCGSCKDCHYRDGAMFLQETVLHLVGAARSDWGQYNGAKRVCEKLRKQIQQLMTDDGVMRTHDLDRPDAEESCGILRRRKP